MIYKYPNKRPLTCAATLLGSYLLSVNAFATSTPMIEMNIDLRGPEVYKLDWNTRALAAADIDNNGYTDLIVINNEKAKLELLYQYAPNTPRQSQKENAQRHGWQMNLDDSRFWKAGIPISAQAFSLAAGDLNNDGLPELAYTTHTEGLVVISQQQDGRWQHAWTYDQVEINQWTGSILIDDINNDDRNDLLLMDQHALLLFYQDESAQFSSPKRYPLADTDNYSPTLADVNHDNLLDILYWVPNSQHALRLRLQQSSGSFGVERMLDYPTPRSPALLLASDSTGAHLATVQNHTGLIDFLQLGPATQPSNHEPTLTTITPQIYALPSAVNSASLYALADIDGDALEDILIADSKGAQVWIYQQRLDGAFNEAVSFPSLSGTRAISAADTDGDGRAEVFVASPGERNIGISYWQSSGRLSYPESLPVTGKPLALSGVKIASYDHPGLAAIVRQGKNWQLVTLSRHKENPQQWEQQQALALQKLGLRTAPDDLLALDYNQDGLQDLIIFIAGDSALVLLQQSDGTFQGQKAGTEMGQFRRQLHNRQSGNITHGDIDNDGAPDLLIAGKGYVRMIKANSQGQISVADQFNAPDPEQAITSALPYDLDQDGRNELILFAHQGDELSLLRRDSAGILRPWRNISTGRIDILASHLLNRTQTKPQRLLYLGKDRFWTLAVSDQDVSLRSKKTFESTLQNMSYQRLATGDLDGDGRRELIALDNQNTHILQVLTQTQDQWRSQMHFAVFETSPRDQQRGTRREPREILVQDIDQNGRADIVLLVHDRILVYPSL